MKPLRLGTRQSALALTQAHLVAGRLRARHAGLQIEIVKLTTEGDRILDRTLAAVGGKGLFIKELEQALLEGRIDLAVHSMKDMTVSLPDGLHIAAVSEREDPRDAFLSRRYRRLADLPPGARVGTASLRRQCQIATRFPALDVVTLRGNVTTRIAKLDAGEFDAVILAAAGLKRLGLADRITDLIPAEESLPAVGQGALCIESRRDDVGTNALLAVLDDPETRACVTAERAMNAALEGGCQVPIAGFAVIESGELWLRGLVGATDGSRVLEEQARGPRGAPEALGARVGQALLAKGAREILDEVYGRA